jgi:hypothetical protein
MRILLFAKKKKEIHAYFEVVQTWMDFDEVWCISWTPIAAG